MMELRQDGDDVTLFLDGHELIRHTARCPALYAGRARLGYSVFKGRFRIRDRTRMEPLSRCEAAPLEDGWALVFAGSAVSVTLRLREAGGLLRVRVDSPDPSLALRMEVAAGYDERIYGCGEHFTKLDLRGQKARIWVEEHVGTVDAVFKVLALYLGLRPRRKPFRRYATYHPQPTFVSSALYFCHVDADAHGVLDFTRRDRHGLLFHAVPREIVFGSGPDYPAILEKLTGFLGRQSELPDWMHDGMILGIQDGTDVCRAKVRTLREAGAAICGVWAQDWEGQRVTYFGKQLKWDYRWDRTLYPDLPERISEWRKEGVAFLGYANPYLCDDGELFKEAAGLGYLARHPSGSIYLAKSTSFPFGIVDLTNPDAWAWYKRALRAGLVDLGMAGWMADFGEYLPADAVLRGGSGAEWHNRWPVLWARLNREILEDAGLLGTACFFTRSGYSGSARYTTLAWNGDQHVDWSDDYGIGSVVRASLSLAMSGLAFCHSDVGGYTTLPRMTRSKELFLRWLELGAFSPVMRSHEGNRPEANWQFDSDAETVAAVARFSRVHAALKPYLKAVGREAAARGLPAMRPLFFHYSGDFGYDQDHAYLLGRDLAVYPVLDPGVGERKLSLPDDDWVGLWDGEAYAAGERTVSAPPGTIPVFYRRASEWAGVFAKLESGKIRAAPRGCSPDPSIGERSVRR